MKKPPVWVAFLYKGVKNRLFKDKNIFAADSKDILKDPLQYIMQNYALGDLRIYKIPKVLAPQ